MPDHMNRSPCPRPLRESARAPRTGPIREGNTAPAVTLREETRAGKTVMLLDVTVAVAGRVNRNGRLYPREVWENAITHAQDDLTSGKLWGLLEHPEDNWDSWDPIKGRVERICVRYETLTLDGDTVKATGVVLDTATGRDVKALIEGGIAVGISSNGTGTSKYLKASEVLPDYSNPEQYIEVIQDDYRLQTIDIVSDPSDPAGVARQQQERRRKESSMKWNEAVKKTAQRLGLTAEAFAEQHPEWAAELNAPAAPATPPAPTDAGTVSLEAYRALETNVVGLTSQVKDLTDQLRNERRDGIAVTALESARLPSSGTIRNGDTEIDLDASFRAELIDVARRADTDDAARESVATAIVKRRAVLGQRESAGARQGGSGRIPLPAGDNSRAQTERDRSNGESRQIEGIRGRAGLL